MPENRAMSNAAETPATQDPVTARTGVIASNDPTSPVMYASAHAPAAATTHSPATVGALLREGREKISLSAGDIASKLRMGLKQVNALENSDYAALPTGTFLRGFVRNYAKAVALNADEVLVLLERTHSGAGVVKATPVVMPSQQNIKVPTPGGELATPNGRAFIIGIVFLLLLAAVWYWWEYVFPYRGEGGRTKTGATQTIAVPQPAMFTATALPLVPAATLSASPAGIEESKPDSFAGTPPATNFMAPNSAPPTGVSPSIVAESTSSAVAEAPHVQIREMPVSTGSAALGFTFRGESWVEVVDATGKTVLSRRFKTGDAEEVIGRAPFSVVIGNAKATRMAFNGQEFDLEAHTRGAVARMTVK